MKLGRRNSRQAPVAAGSALTDATESAVPEHGPMDASLEPQREGELNFGSIRLVATPGVEMRLEVDGESGEFSAIQASINGESMQLQAFAAPKSSGIWAAVRADIRDSVEAAGGSYTEEDGPWGTEMVARLPHQNGGSVNFTAVRFIGVEGPRWFLRVVISGGSAERPAHASALGQVLDSVRVHRGDDPRAARELLPLEVPRAAAAEEEIAEPTFEPFARGPEITEVR